MRWSESHAVDRSPAVRGRALLVAVATVLVVAGCSASPPTGSTPSGSGTPSTSPSAAASSSASSSAPDTSLPPLPATPAPLAPSTTSPPVRVDLPTIGVASKLENLGLLPDGSLASPSQYPVAGWYDEGVRPGDDGPAIIAGHVDSYQGPAVFYRLSSLKAGDPVVVTRADGKQVRFIVQSQAQYPKSRFPTGEVYGPTPTPELKLITCTGVFDRSVRSYEDNLVVTAVLAGS